MFPLKNTRVVIAVDGKGFLGTIQLYKDYKIYVLLDTKRKIKISINSNRILGIGIDTKSSRPIALPRVSKYIRRSIPSISGMSAESIYSKRRRFIKLSVKNSRPVLLNYLLPIFENLNADMAGDISTSRNGSIFIHMSKNKSLKFITFLMRKFKAYKIDEVRYDFVYKHIVFRANLQKLDKPNSVRWVIFAQANYYL